MAFSSPNFQRTRVPPTAYKNPTRQVHKSSLGHLCSAHKQKNKNVRKNHNAEKDTSVLLGKTQFPFENNLAQ